MPKTKTENRFHGDSTPVLRTKRKHLAKAIGALDELRAELDQELETRTPKRKAPARRTRKVSRKAA